MNKEEAEIVKMGMEVALRPVTDIAADLLGVAGGDWLREKRTRNRKRLQDATAKILEEQGVKDPTEPSPSVAIPLLRAAQDESRDELVMLWAKLLASAMNPAKESEVRRQYIDIVGQMEPLDVLILSGFAEAIKTSGQQSVYFANALGRSPDEIVVSFENLVRLNLAAPPGERPAAHGYVRPTALGKELVRLLG